MDHKSFFSLDRHVNEFIQIVSFFERSSFYLRCETVIGIVRGAVVIKHVAFFTICAKLTMAFTSQFTFELSCTLLFPDMAVVSDLNIKIGGSTDLATKKKDG